MIQIPRLERTIEKLAGHSLPLADIPVKYQMRGTPQHYHCAKYRISPNKRSLRIDRHLGELRGPGEYSRSFSAIFGNFKPIFAYFDCDIPSECAGGEIRYAQLLAQVLL